MTYKYYEIVKTGFLEDIVSENGKYTNRYKIEIYKTQESLYYARLFRLDSFDLVATTGKIPSTDNIYVEDNYLTIIENTSFKNINDCLNFSLQKLAEAESNQKSISEINA